RSSRLKHLTLACCDHISREGLTRAVTKFPKLEELHLILTPAWIYAGDIETISISCPLLKSFAFNRRGYMFRAVDNSCALAIAKNMPNLRHLGLLGNDMSDEGVKAILDGCPHLESLDLRQCFKVELLGDLDTRCSERIKDLRRPSDLIVDYEYYDEFSYDSYNLYYLENYYDHIDDDNGDNDDLYDSTYSVDHYFGGYERSDYWDQVEHNYWDATDRSRKGKMVTWQQSRRCSERM
ncbi:putative F-box/LRR-repeat protein 23, partial [Phtheirospermum japonicum]